MGTCTVDHSLLSQQSFPITHGPACRQVGSGHLPLMLFGVYGSQSRSLTDLAIAALCRWKNMPRDRPAAPGVDHSGEQREAAQAHHGVGGGAGHQVQPAGQRCGVHAPALRTGQLRQRLITAHC